MVSLNPQCTRPAPERVPSWHVPLTERVPRLEAVPYSRTIVARLRTGFGHAAESLDRGLTWGGRAVLLRQVAKLVATRDEVTCCWRFRPADLELKALEVGLLLVRFRVINHEFVGETGEVPQ